MTFRPIPKNPPYRNQKLRDYAREAPICFRCMKFNDGTVVGCHSNAIEDGHGTGQKAHDVVAYMCSECHRFVDENWHNGGEEAFHKAVYKTIVWLFQKGYIKCV